MSSCVVLTACQVVLTTVVLAERCAHRFVHQYLCMDMYGHKDSREQWSYLLRERDKHKGVIGSN